ncbi:MAG: histidinol dehydrogenase [Thermoleophilia bacterium]|nr:histidinol dehydrogenase [Thermoleophilia bacterium]
MGALAIRRLTHLDPAERRVLLDRATAEILGGELNRSVAAILEDVRLRGDEAICRALRRFDGVDCPPERLRIGEDEVTAARAAVPGPVVDAVRTGLANIRAFNELVLADASWEAELAPGLTVGEQARPIASAGLFVPSGKGSFPSVLMQIGMPAVVAGVPELAVVVPPTAGRGLEVDPAVLVVAAELGLENVFRANGPAGIAALAFGTETFPRVSKIVGPGSPAVTAAQLQVQLHGCSTAMLFGPSESLVIADDSADPVLVAADVLNEAEHGLDSAALLVTPSEQLVAAVSTEIDRQLAELPEWRREYAASAISRFGGALLVRDLDEACAFANEYAPEHLQVNTADPQALLPKLEHAGEILLGPTPFSAANYVLGIPATLPTGGFARVSSGVNARTFVKTSSIGGATPDALARLAPAILALAEHEGFPAHAAALRIRGLG